MFERPPQSFAPIVQALAVPTGDYLSVLLTILAIVVAALVLRALLSRAISRLAQRLLSSNRRRGKDKEGITQESKSGADGARQLAGQLLLPGENDQRREQRIATMTSLLRYATTVVILVIALVMVLGELGVSIGPLIAGAGIAGIAIGFGAQSLVRDYLTGIFMLAEDQYGVGDVVDVGGASGVVERVTLRLTVLRDLEGTVWYVPNGEVRRVGNKSYQWARSLLDIGVAYDADVAEASAIIKQVADDLWRTDGPQTSIIEEPELWGVEDLGSDAVVIRLAVKTSPGQQWAVSRELRARIKAALDDAGIAIPFPQQTVWLHDAGRHDASTTKGE